MAIENFYSIVVSVFTSKLFFFAELKIFSSPRSQETNEKAKEVLIERDRRGRRRRSVQFNPTS